MVSMPSSIDQVRFSPQVPDVAVFAYALAVTHAENTGKIVGDSAPLAPNTIISAVIPEIIRLLFMFLPPKKLKATPQY